MAGSEPSLTTWFASREGISELAQNHARRAVQTRKLPAHRGEFVWATPFWRSHSGATGGLILLNRMGRFHSKEHEAAGLCSLNMRSGKISCEINPRRLEFARRCQPFEGC